MPTVIVYWSPGRTEQQKQRVAQRIAQALVDDGGARVDDVLIIFQHIEAGNSARGLELLALTGSEAASEPSAADNNHQDTETTHGS